MFGRQRTVSGSDKSSQMPKLTQECIGLKITCPRENINAPSYFLNRLVFMKLVLRHLRETVSQLLKQKETTGTPKEIFEHLLPIYFSF